MLLLYTARTYLFLFMCACVCFLIVEVGGRTKYFCYRFETEAVTSNLYKSKNNKLIPNDCICGGQSTWGQR